MLFLLLGKLYSSTGFQVEECWRAKLDVELFLSDTSIRDMIYREFNEKHSQERPWEKNFLTVTSEKCKHEMVMMKKN